MKYKIGDKVKWNDGKHYKDDKRIDIITSVIKNLFGDTQYMTKEVNNPKGTTAKIGKAYESYLVLVWPNKEERWYKQRFGTNYQRMTKCTVYMVSTITAKLYSEVSTSKDYTSSLI